MLSRNFYNKTSSSIGRHRIFFGCFLYVYSSCSRLFSSYPKVLFIPLCFLFIPVAAQWYHHTTIYQIYPRSFYDSNDDGIGDIPGIIQKLDYIKSLGFETIWCSPFFASPQKDFGYDISDYRSIAPEYGSMDDVRRLIDEVHQRNMKIVFDMVMNHTSIEHEWFKRDEACQNESDYYLWRDKPNNWKSMTGGSGWHYSETRKQYYWASFLPFQPDLNYRNPKVKADMLENVRFWLAMGVDGFRLDIFNVIFKDEYFRNNPRSGRLLPSENNPAGFFQQPKYTINRPESFDFAKELRQVCNEFGEKMLLGEVSGDRKTIRKFLGNETNDGLGLVFNFEMLRFRFSARYFRNLLTNCERDFARPFSPVYVFSNHDRRRSIKRLKNNVAKAKLLHVFQLTVRGVPCVYYGEEIGMSDVKMPYPKALDPIPHKYRYIPRFLIDWSGETLNRDEVRTPMQWNDSVHAGFSKAETTWLPVAKNYRQINVQRALADSTSLLQVFKVVLKIRQQHKPLQLGDTEIIPKDELSKNILGFTRSYQDEKILILLNFSARKTKVTTGKKYECLYRLHANSVGEDAVYIGPYGAVILKIRDASEPLH
jgi:oligo-1,6-glucosidase/alpha-glucosidase